MLWAVVIIAATIFVAYANGANDNFKGVATLFGSGTADYGKALGWATVTTLLGSLCAFFWAGKLVKAFSGKGLVPDALVASPAFMAAVIFGAALTVFLASKTGIPISTTHSLTGALFGVGFTAIGRNLVFSSLGKNFFMPLLLSPFIALGLTLVIYLFTKVYSGKMLGVPVQKILDSLHFLSAGAVSFARGLNDTPKIVALSVVFGALGLGWNIGLVAAFMALGGVFGAKKVAETMSRKITAINHGQGLTANLVTAFLVIFASRLGVPVSTTHVSCGSLFGIGLANGQARWKMISGIFGAWVLTLPVSAILSGAIYWVIR